jgi:hypothetical protein
VIQSFASIKVEKDPCLLYRTILSQLHNNIEIWSGYHSVNIKDTEVLASIHKSIRMRVDFDLLLCAIVGSHCGLV